MMMMTMQNPISINIGFPLNYPWPQNGQLILNMVIIIIILKI